jgi:hypothetical protein
MQSADRYDPYPDADPPCVWRTVELEDGVTEDGPWLVQVLEHVIHEDLAQEAA